MAATNMAATTAAKTAIKTAAQPQTRLFHARMLVTRLEEWSVEAASAEEARALLAAGAGHRCSPGESIQVELERMLDEQ